MGYQQATRKRFSLLKGELLASERNKQQKPAELSAGRLVPGDQRGGGVAHRRSPAETGTEAYPFGTEDRRNSLSLQPEASCRENINQKGEETMKRLISMILAVMLIATCLRSRTYASFYRFFGLERRRKLCDHLAASHRGTGI